MKPGPRCYFSFRSPYAWLAVRALEREGLGMGCGTGLEYLPYFEPPQQMRARLHEGGARLLYTPMSRERHLYILSDVKRTLAAEGIAPRWPVDRDPDWSVPHLVWLACPDAQARRAFAHAIFEARWLRGEDVWTVQAAEAALRGFLPGAEADAVLACAAGAPLAARAVEALHRAWVDDVFGVPFMICGRERFWGNDRTDLFIAATRAAKEKELQRETA